VRGFGRTIALWGFNALLFRADLDSFGSLLIAAVAVFTSQLSCQMVIRSTYPRSGFSTNRRCALRELIGNGKSASIINLATETRRLDRLAHRRFRILVRALRLTSRKRATAWCGHSESVGCHFASPALLFRILLASFLHPSSSLFGIFRLKCFSDSCQGFCTDGDYQVGKMRHVSPRACAAEVYWC